MLILTLETTTPFKMFRKQIFEQFCDIVVIFVVVVVVVVVVCGSFCCCQILILTVVVFVELLWVFSFLFLLLLLWLLLFVSYIIVVVPVVPYPFSEITAILLVSLSATMQDSAVTASFPTRVFLDLNKAHRVRIPPSSMNWSCVKQNWNGFCKSYIHCCCCCC